jgi:hypothetical protein
MFHELEKYKIVETPLGRGTAFLIESSDDDYFWTVILDDSCAIVTFRQNQLKVCRNYSMGWGFSDAEMLAIIKKWMEKHEHS